MTIHRFMFDCCPVVIYRCPKMAEHNQTNSIDLMAN